LIRELERKAKNETETGSIAEEVNFIADYIKKSMAAMKHDFKKGIDSHHRFFCLAQLAGVYLQ
jgi:hypothetical protein